MKRIILIILAVLLAGTVAMARQAAVMVSGSGIKITVIPEDEDIMKACPELRGGSVTYKDEADLEAKISQIEEYFADHKLSKTYKLTFWDKDTKSVVGEVSIGRGARKPATGSDTKDHLLMGILAAAAALVFLLLFLLVNKARKGVLLSLLGSIFLLCAVASGILAIIFLATIGLKLLLAVVGITGFFAILLLIFLSGGHTKEWRENERRKAEERNHINDIMAQNPNPGQEGYTVRGKYFSSFYLARTYADSIGAKPDEIVEWRKMR